MQTLRRASFKLHRRVFLATKTLRQWLRGQHPQLTLFVAGVQRSGTNMMMDILERSLETDVYHETDQRAFLNYQMRSEQVIRRLRAQSNAPVFIIKALCELQTLPHLMQEFAPAKAIWMLRNYDDVVNSMLKSFKNQAKQVQRIASNRDSDGWLGAGMSDDTHGIIRELVETNINDASAAALIWYFRNILFFEHGFDTNDQVLLVRYERLAHNTNDELARVFRFIGLPYTSKAPHHIHSSSVSKDVPKPIGEAIRVVCDELRRRFEALT